MAIFNSLQQAISESVNDGDTLALEGFTHLIPFAAGHEIIRQKKRDLTLVRMTPDLIYDQLVGAGCAKKLIFSWGGNPGVGSLHRLRDAFQNDYPHALESVEHSHAAMANAYEAGAAGLPMAVFRGYIGSELPDVNDAISSVKCPFTGEELACVPAIKPDVGIIHAQKADRQGNVLIEGIVGVQKEVVLSSKCSIVTVEEIVDDLNAGPNSCVLPGWTINHIAVAPKGAHPSYAHGYYQRDNQYYLDWDAISRDRARFNQWLEDEILQTGAN
ncbi:CoA transferase subunit A [Aliiglaciecola sp. SL4]|uniref:CoA transferase subunit A n=1 Tax=Aliiglaciecola sp. SL4 TaxID=3239806 RepID=UPI00355BC9C1